MENSDSAPSVKLDVLRPHADFSDLLKIIAAYYETYDRAVAFVGPWLAKQTSSMFMVPDREQLKAALGKERSGMSWRARAALIDAVIHYLQQHRGRRTLITPNPNTHHSAQFPNGTFEIMQVENSVQLTDARGKVRSGHHLHKIEFSGAAEPVYIENLKIPAHQVQFIILRPCMGKLGTASVSRWEVLVYKQPHTWLVEHTDSRHNPRFSGII